MTGPEHYAEAERHIEYANSHPPDDGKVTIHLAFAQVEATLALAAATAMNDGDGGMGVSDYCAWCEVCSVSKPPPGVTP